MLTVTISGADKTAAALARIGAAMKRPLMLGLDAMMKDQVNRTFSRQADPVTGSPWKRTGPLALRNRPSGGGQTLRATAGGLLDSIVSRAPMVTDTSVTIGTDKAYGPIHQTGGIVRPKTAKKLAIPLTREAVRAGSARRWMAQNQKKYFFTPNAICKREPGGRVVAHFARLDSSTIPMRRYLGIGPEYGREIEAFVVKVAERAASSGGGA